jgi:antirestriction protein ArdC
MQLLHGRSRRPLLRHYAVFHASQVDGAPPFVPPAVDETPWRRPEANDIILRNSGPKILTGGDRAFYSPVRDFIQLPPENAFRGPPERAAVVLHETGHWTGAPHRAVAGYCTVTVKVVCTVGVTEGFPVATTVKV